MLLVILFSRYKKGASTNAAYTIPVGIMSQFSYWLLRALPFSMIIQFYVIGHPTNLYTLIEFTYILYHIFAQNASALKELHKPEVFVKERLQFCNNAILFGRSVAAAKARDRRQDAVNICAGSL